MSVPAPGRSGSTMVLPMVAARLPTAARAARAAVSWRTVTSVPPVTARASGAKRSGSRCSMGAGVAWRTSRNRSGVGRSISCPVWRRLRSALSPACVAVVVPVAVGTGRAVAVGTGGADGNGLPAGEDRGRSLGPAPVKGAWPGSTADRAGSAASAGDRCAIGPAAVGLAAAAAGGATVSNSVAGTAVLAAPTGGCELSVGCAGRASRS